MHRLFDFLRIRDVPALARRNYAAEWRHASLWGFVVGSVEGGIASVVAAKTFDASEVLTAIVFALPNIMDMLNLLWSVLIRGRRRIPTFTCLGVGAVLAASSIALNSPGWKPWGAWLFAAQVGGTNLFLSGLVTLQTTMWKVNYPASHRARISGRLQTLRMLLVLITTASFSALFDDNPQYYRYVYPIVGLLGLVALWPLQRIRMRGEKAELKQFRRHVARQADELPRRLAPAVGLREAFAILREDRNYNRYMLAQFLLGSANFFTDPVLVTILAKRLHFAYFTSTLVMSQIPYVVILLSIPYWARWFDRVGVLRFRVHNSEYWLASCTCVTVAMALLETGHHAAGLIAMGVLLIGRVMYGLARGGGVIAWNLGHLHFARDHQTELYMGIHVAMTGFRGLVMPILGMLAYRSMGWASFAIAMALAIGSHVLFRRLAAADARSEAAPGGRVHTNSSQTFDADFT